MLWGSWNLDKVFKKDYWRFY